MLMKTVAQADGRQKTCQRLFSTTQLNKRNAFKMTNRIGLEKKRTIFLRIIYFRSITTLNRFKYRFSDKSSIDEENKPLIGLIFDSN
jgi:hypothetical protein